MSLVDQFDVVVQEKKKNSDGRRKSYFQLAKLGLQINVHISFYLLRSIYPGFF